MKRLTTVLLIVAVIMSAGALYAETTPDMGSPEGVKTIQCSVQEVKFMAPSWGPIRGTFRGMFYVMALDVSSDSDIRTVYLGPAMYLDRQGMKIGRYDSLEITGFEKVYDGEKVLVAQKISKSGHVTILRDQQGIPLWGEPRPVSTSY